MLRQFSYMLLIFIFISSASNAFAVGDSPVMDRIIKNGELVIGTSANMPPMTMKDKDGDNIGLDMDMARIMAASMGVKLRIETMAFKQLIPAIESGKIDMVISNMTMNPKRNMKVAFVGPYMTSGKCLITKEETLAKAESEELNSENNSFVVLKDTTSEKLVKILMPKTKSIPVDSMKQAVEMVKNDKVQAIFTEFPICIDTIKNNPDSGFVSVLSLLTYEPIGIALAGNDPLLINWVRNFLKRMDGMGTLEALTKNWMNLEE